MTEKEILEKLRDPNLSNDEKNALIEQLYDGIEIRQKTIHEKWEEGGITILPPKNKKTD